MEWQTFDIDFRAPRFDASGIQKIEDARITLVHNGITIYDDVAIKSVRGSTSRLGETSLGPIYLQEHGVPYQFRNIWVIDKTLKEKSKSPNSSSGQQNENLPGGGKEMEAMEGVNLPEKNIAQKENSGSALNEKSVNSVSPKSSIKDNVIDQPEIKSGGSGKNVKATYQEELNPVCQC